MAFVPENNLERAMIDAATNPAQIGRFYALLLESDLFALGRSEAGKIEMAQIRLHDRDYHPLFSAPIRLQSYAQEHPKYFSMKGRDLFNSARGAYFLLTPGWEYAKELVPHEIGYLLQTENLAKGQAPTGKILISQPLVYPAILADALRKLFATRPEVETAYLAQMAIEGHKEPPHPIVGVKLEGPWEPLSQAIRQVVSPLPQGTQLAAMPLTEAYKVLGDQLVRYEAFYTRGGKPH